MMAVVTGALVPLFTGTASAVQFCNTTPIVFTPPPQPTQSVQALNPYPSQITVSGLSGTVTDVNVLLHDLTYTFPADLDLLVVAPNGTAVLVMSDVGGTNDISNSTTDVDLTLDDEAAAALPANTQLTSGTYRPLDDDSDPGSFDASDTFLAPAPAPTSTSLSAFDGINPNGTWSLYVVDDEPGPPDIQDFGGGWCLDITTTATSTTSSSTTSSSTTSTTMATTTTSSSTTSTTMATTTTSSSTTSTTMATTTSTSTTTTLPPTTTSTSTTSTTVPSGLTCDGRAATIVGTAGPDRLVGTPGPDVIVAGGGDDLVVGMGGDDVICGGAGNDSLQGGEGNDRLFGQGGTDQCVGGPGVDVAATCEATYEVP